MGSDDDGWRIRFPALLRDAYVDFAECRVRYTRLRHLRIWYLGFTWLA